VFVSMLSSGDESLVEQSMWAIANIAGDCAEYRDGCISVGTACALSGILDRSLQSKSTQLARLSVWGLSNLCRGHPPPPFDSLLAAIPSLGRALSQSNDSEILADTAWALSYLTDGADSDRMRIILSSFDIKRIVALLGHPSSSVHSPILRAVGNLVSGESAVTQLVVNSGALNHLKSLVSSLKKSVRKEALWTISNICADSALMIDSVVASGVLNQVCDMIKNGRTEADVRKEAVWILCNISTVGSAVQVNQLVARYNMIDHLCEYLTACRDTQSLKSCLDALYAILSIYIDDPTGYNPFRYIVEECGGLETIEQLQQDESAEVYNAAVRLLESFFDCQPSASLPPRDL
jgi:importin subunit alpha-1